MHILPGEHASETVDPGTAVMIPLISITEASGSRSGQAGDKTSNILHRLADRNCLVIKVSCHDDPHRAVPGQQYL